MTKDAEARVRDELLQTLYSHILRCRLASAQVAPQSSYAAAADALAAGLAVSLRREDLLLLPAKDFESFRTMLGLPPQGNVIPQRLQSSGIQPQARGEAAAVAQALGAACAAAQGEAGRLVLCFPAHGYQGRSGKPAARLSAGLPTTWQAAGVYAARLALPLLFITDKAAASRSSAVHRAIPGPAPLYPSIPVDREDALAIYRVGFECVGRARAGNGPSHIEAVPFLLRGGSSVKGAEEPDSLGRLEAALRRRGAYSKAWRRSLERQLITEMASS
jgi:hypothetical protein